LVRPGCATVIAMVIAAIYHSEWPATGRVIQWWRVIRTGWTDGLPRPTLWVMPIPSEKVHRLGDHGGLWSLSLRCRCCRHMAEIPAQQLIERHGPNKRLVELTVRLCCRLCQEKHCHCKGRNFEAMVSFRR
jgi:hypothetical protein